MKRFNQACLLAMAVMLALYLVAYGLGGALVSQAHQSQEPAMQYKVELVAPTEVLATVNRLAVEEWELCGQGPGQGGWQYLYFQKPYQP